MPLPAKLDNVPPVTVTSEVTKFVDTSLKVNVKLAVSPDAKLDLLLATAIVGAMVSTNVTLPLESKYFEFSPKK